MKKTYNYFVSFKHGKGFGNAESRLSKPIENISDIKLLARSLEKEFGFDENSLVIINYQLFNGM